MQFSGEGPPLHRIFQFSSPAMSRDQILPVGPRPGFPTSRPIGRSFGDASCMEQLLVHCATAIESNDATLAQQLIWVLNNLAPPDGDPNQRLAAAFLRALVARAARRCSCKPLAAAAAAAAAKARRPRLAAGTHRFTTVELAAFVDLSPWHRFGFTAANAAIRNAAGGRPLIHIVDLSTTHCMQTPTLIEGIAHRRAGSPDASRPRVKLTVAGIEAGKQVLPRLDLSREEMGSRLANFARSRGLELELRVIPTSYSDGFSSLIEELRVERAVTLRGSGGPTLIVNCHMTLRSIPEETVSGFSCSPRTRFLKGIRALEPSAVVLVDEDVDFTSNGLVGRLRSAFNYMWIPYDAADAFLPKGSRQRQWLDADMRWKIENVEVEEGRGRVERQEPKSRWARRMREAGFRSVGFGEDAAAEVKGMLEEHAAGWGLKREEDGLVLTWKGHSAVFATAWVPAAGLSY